MTTLLLEDIDVNVEPFGIYDIINNQINIEIIDPKIDKKIMKIIKDLEGKMKKGKDLNMQLKPRNLKEKRYLLPSPWQ